jgi:hypothetical protein
VAPEVGLWSIPPDPAVPAELHGSKVVLVAGMYVGPADEAGPALAPLRELGTPLLDASGTLPYVDAQGQLDPLFATGQRYYWKSLFLERLSDEAIARLLECDAERPTPESLVVLRTLGGAIDRMAAGDSAYAHRGARHNLSVDGTWTDPELDGRLISWVRSTWETLRPFSTGGVYVNFSGLGEEADELRAAVQGANQQRLEEIRAAYDPRGLFDAAARRP